MELNLKKISLAMAAIISLTACNQQMSNKEQGAITGGLLGGLLGTQIGKGSGRTAGFIGGTIIGAMIGSNVGERIDEANRKELSKALATLPVNRSHSWIDARYGYQYSVTPIKSFHRGATLCRRYRVSVLINGQVRTAVGRACQHNTNDWHIVD